MADLVGFVGAIKSIAEAITGSLAHLKGAKEKRRQRAARVCGHISTCLDTLQAGLEQLNAARQTHAKAKPPSSVHKALGELQTYLEELSAALQGLIDRTKIAALRRRLNALVRARRDVVDGAAITDKMIEDLADTSGRFKALANTLA